MRFADFNKLKIVKSYTFKTNETVIDLREAATIFDIKECARQVLKKLITEESGIENFYRITLVCKPFATAVDNDDYFLTAVNIISAIFFDIMCTNKGRGREHRLDAPEKLKKLKTTMSLVKRATNSQTLVDKFNLRICWRISADEECVYELVPQEDGELDE